MQLSCIRDIHVCFNSSSEMFSRVRGVRSSSSLGTNVKASTLLKDNRNIAKCLFVVDRKDNATVFNRLDAESLDVWLKDYSLGEIWEKNVIGGQPLM